MMVDGGKGHGLQKKTDCLLNMLGFMVKGDGTLLPDLQVTVFGVLLNHSGFEKKLSIFVYLEMVFILFLGDLQD